MGDNEPVGLGGWMILFQIAIYFTLFSFVYDIIMNLSSPIESYSYPSMFLDIIAIALFIYCLFLMYKKKTNFPKMMKIAMWTYLGMIAIFTFILLFFLSGEVNSDYIVRILAIVVAIIKPLIFAGVWTWYLNVSVRVKNTFVN